jgi:hypothetical protein
MSKGRITLSFFIDAFGWELAQSGGAFRSLAPHAYRQRTILGYSCAAQPTILTGTMPSEHGHWAMFQRVDRSELASLARWRFLPRPIGGHRRFRRRLLALHRRWSGYTGYYNLYNVPFGLFRHFDLSEKKDIYAPRGFEGDVKSIFDILSCSGVPYRVWNWRSSLDRSFSELRAAVLGDEPIRFALLYTACIDALLHDSIADDSAVHAAMSDLERRIAEIVTCARAEYADVDVLIFSDHGMTKTTATCDLMSIVGTFGPKQGRDYMVFYDSTMARFWLLDEAARTDLVSGLDERVEGTILSDDTLRQEGVFFEDRRYGELIFLMNPGVLIVPSFMGKRAPNGMHGFSPDHRDSDAVLMSNRPILQEPAHIRDTFRVMLELAR